MFASLYACFLVLHRVCVLDMHISLCYCASLNACSDDHLLYYVIIVVISIWLFWCMIKLFTCFTSCLFDRNLIVILYLSFYYLLYLEGLMCFVQVFQVTGIYVPSSSQLLWFMIGGEREKEFCVLLTIFLLCSSFMIMFSCLNYICFVPMLCSLVLIVNVMHFFKYITLVPLLDFISLMQLPCVVVSVEC